MRIIFFGEDSFSNTVLQSLIDKSFNVTLVVSPYYENLIHKRLENTCYRNQIEYIRVVDFKTKNFIDKLKALSPELIVISHFEKLIQKEIINIPKYGCINLHPSFLPYYRGMSPQHWPIINGENETGVTVHFVDERADTGDIILQKKVIIEPEMYVHDLQLEFIKIYRTIVVDAINLITDDNFVPIEQSHLKGSCYGRLKKEDCKIDLTKSYNQILNLIRGVSKPYYGSFIDDTIIWKARIADDKEDNYRRIKNNKVGLYFAEKKLILNLVDGALIIEKFEKRK